MNTWDSLSRQIKDKDTGEVISNDTRPIRDVYAQAMMAPQYNDLTFPVPAGQHCIYEGKLYVAAQGIQTSEVWTAAHWTEVKLGAELANLKSQIGALEGAVDDISEPMTWKPGYYTLTYGKYYAQTEPATYHCTEIYDGDTLPALVGTELFTSDSFIMVWKDTSYRGYLMNGVWKKNQTVLDEAPEFNQWAVVLHNVSNYADVRHIPYLVASMDDVNESAEAYINGRSIRVAHIFPAATATTVYKIRVNESNIVIPKFCCVFYGNKERYRFSAETTVARVAYGSGDVGNAEYLIFNAVNNTLRFVVSSQNVTGISADDYLVATFQYGLNGNSLPPSYVSYPAVDDTIFNNNDKNLIDERIIETRYCGNNNKTGLTLIHFSDIHGSTANISRIIQVYSAYQDYIDGILHTGDSVNTYYANDNPFDTVGGSQVMNVIGNHDCWIQGDTWYNATAAQAYAKFFVGSDTTNPYITSWNVESAGENLCYYYKDYADYDIRLIVLDCMHYDATQETWFIQALAGAKTGGLSVIVATHYAAQSGITPINCTFTSYGKTIDAVTGERIERLQESAFDCVDDFIAAGGKFICWLVGHVHYDYIGTVTDHANQLVILINCGVMDARYGTDKRVTGTKTQDCMNVIGFDTVNKLVKICRIGISQDWFGREKNLLCVSYDTKQVIGNS